MSVGPQDLCVCLFSSSSHGMNVETMTSLNQWTHSALGSCILHTILHQKKSEKLGEMLILGMSQGKCKVNLRNPVTPERNKSAPRPVEFY